MTKIYLGLAGLVLVFSLGSVNASLVDNGIYTTDTSGGLDWLDLTETAGFSYNQIMDGEGGWIGAGWRYAFEAEIDLLFETYLGIPEGVYSTGLAFTGAVEILTLFGATSSTAEEPPLLERPLLPFH